MIHISPSILAADFSNLGQAVCEAERAGAASIHIDFMDGHYVHNLTFGIDLIPALRKHTSLPLVAHLEIVNPDAFVEDFVRVGADMIIVCEDTCPDLPSTIGAIRKHGVQVGVSLNPDRPLALLQETLPPVDLVLLLAVSPGFGGQAFTPSVLEKISAGRAWIERTKIAAALAVDGGVNRETVAEVVRAGADTLVIGSAIFAGDFATNMQTLQQIANGSIIL